MEQGTGEHRSEVLDGEEGRKNIGLKEASCILGGWKVGVDVAELVAMLLGSQ